MKIVKIQVCCLLSLALIACVSTQEKVDNAANVHLQLGVRYLELGRLPLAKENIEMALSENSNNAQAHNALAYLYERINKLADAREQYETAFSLAPDDLGVQNNYGRFLCDRREFEKGMELLGQASSNLLNDKQWLALTNAGRCQIAMGQSQKAVKYFKDALQINPTYAPALEEMQRISYLNNNFMAARAYFQRYTAVEPETPAVLWMAIQTEQALGNKEQAKEFQSRLLEKFPNSNEAKQIDSTLHRRLMQQQQ